MLFSNILGSSLRQFFSFILPFYVTASIIGNYSAANSFSGLLTLVIFPLNLAFFPLFSKLEPGDSVFEFVYQSIIKYESMVVFPITAAVIALSDHLVYFLYGASYNLTPLLLNLLMVRFFFTGFGVFITSHILNSQNQTRVTLRRSLINLAVGLPMGLVLIPKYGVIGLIVTQLIAPKAGFLYLLTWLKKNYDIKPNLKVFISISVSTIISFTLCKFTVYVLKLNYLSEILLGGAVLALTYLFLLPLTGALTRENIQDIYSLIEGYEPIKVIINPFYKFLLIISRPEKN
jgi:O-antigen/teichoic acid export membrane protein